MKQAAGLRWGGVLLACALTLGIFFSGSSTVRAAGTTIYVDRAVSIADSKIYHVCSLFEAVVYLFVNRAYAPDCAAAASGSGTPYTLVLSSNYTYTVDDAALQTLSGSLGWSRPSMTLFPMLSDGLSLTIIGNGATIKRTASQPFRFFWIDGGSLILQDVTLQGGLVSINGCPVVPEGSDCVGGAIVVRTGQLEINRGGLRDNTAGSAGGAVFTGLQSSTVRIHNDSVMDGNRAIAGDGGAIAQYFPSSLTVDASIFTNNTAGSDGGALSVFNGYVSGSWFTNNQAQHSGGGIFVSGALTMVNSTLSLNAANDGYGGALGLDPGARATLSFVTIAQNESIYALGLVPGTSRTATVQLANSLLANFQNFQLFGGFNAERSLLNLRLSRVPKDKQYLHRLNQYQIGRGYRDDEVFYPGVFADPYMAKVYTNRYTEIMSMLMEALYSAQMGNAKSMIILGDPEVRSWFLTVLMEGGEDIAAAYPPLA